MAALLPVTDAPRGWMDLRGSRCRRFQEEKSLPLPGIDPTFFERTAALCNRQVCMPLRADGPVLETTLSIINCQMLFRPSSYIWSSFRGQHMNLPYLPQHGSNFVLFFVSVNVVHVKCISFSVGDNSDTVAV
jgi:hypothetical protein